MPEVDILLKATDEASAAVDKVNKSFGESEQASGKAALTFADMAGALSLVERGLGYAKSAFDATIGATVEYANEVRALQQVTGASAEETSALIQVLDDYKVSATDAMTAQRSLTKDGIVLTTESLAKLSEQYLKITSTAERNAFAQDKLGRNYKAFIEVLQQGPDAIKAASDAVDKNLILTQKSIDEARRYEMQMDNLGDAFMAFKIKAGQDTLPFVTTALQNFTDRMNDSNLVAAIFTTGFDDIAKSIWDTIYPTEDLTEATKTSAAAMDDAGASAEEEAVKQKELEDTIRATTAANNGLLSLTRTIQGENDSYQKSLDDLNTKHADLQSNLDSLINQGWSPYSQKVIEAKDALNKNKQAIEDLAAAHKEKMAQIAYDLFVAKLQADGFTDAEFEIALQAGITAGVLDEATVTMAKGMNDAAQAAADMIQPLDTAAEAARRLAGEYVVNIKTIYSSEGQENYAEGGPTGGNVVHAHAAGGSFLIPQSYGNEGFQLGNGDTASAGEIVTITPKGGAGGNDALLQAIMSTRVTADDIARATVTALQRTGLI